MRNEANVRARLSRRLGADVTRIRLLRNIYYANRDVYKPLSSEIYFQGFSCFFANGCAYFYWTGFLLQSLNRFSVLSSILDLTDKKYPFNFQYPDLIRKMLLSILYFFFFFSSTMIWIIFFSSKRKRGKIFPLREKFGEKSWLCRQSHERTGAVIIVESTRKGIVSWPVARPKELHRPLKGSSCRRRSDLPYKRQHVSAAQRATF